MNKYGYFAYVAYANSVNWINYRGLTMPEWDQLDESVQVAWYNAAMAAIGAYLVNKPSQ